VDPARRVVVHLALAIPVERDADPAELVDVDLLPRGADDGGGLDAVGAGLGRLDGGPVGRVGADRDALVLPLLPRDDAGEI
jgi:hypothetical protein